MGDNADGYPGIAGIGPKGAASLIARYGRIEDFPPEVLGERRELALLFKKLATLRTDATLFADVDEFSGADPPRVSVPAPNGSATLVFSHVLTKQLRVACNRYRSRSGPFRHPAFGRQRRGRRASPPRLSNSRTKPLESVASARCAILFVRRPALTSVCQRSPQCCSPRRSVAPDRSLTVRSHPCQPLPAAPLPSLKAASPPSSEAAIPKTEPCQSRLRSTGSPRWVR